MFHRVPVTSGVDLPMTETFLFLVSNGPSNENLKIHTYVYIKADHNGLPYSEERNGGCVVSRVIKFD